MRGDRQTDCRCSDANAVPVRRGEERAECEKATIYVSNLSYGHEVWAGTERTRLQIQVAEMSFLMGSNWAHTYSVLVNQMSHCELRFVTL